MLSMKVVSPQKYNKTLGFNLFWVSHKYLYFDWANMLIHLYFTVVQFKRKPAHMIYSNFFSGQKSIIFRGNFLIFFLFLLKT